MSKLAALGGSPVWRDAFPIERPSLDQAEASAVAEVIAAGDVSIFSSSEVPRFEEDFSRYVGTSSAVAVTSGTAALHASLVAVRETRGRGSVLFPAYTYAATVNAIELAGLQPIPVDLDPGTPCISLQHAALRARGDTVALLGVNLFGIPFDRDAACGFVDRYKLALIEDCAQSTGGSWDQQKLGSFGIGCHSFGEIKNMTTAEGGMITSNDPGILEAIRLFRHAGEMWRSTGRSTIASWEGFIDEAIEGMAYKFPGHNFRMNAIQAAIGRVQLRKLDELNARRNSIAQSLASVVSEVTGLTAVQSRLASAGSVANRFAVLMSEDFPLSRRALIYVLLMEGIPAGVYYPYLHVHGNKDEEVGPDLTEYPNASRFVDRHIILPCYPAMRAEHVDAVVESLEKVRSMPVSPADIDRIETGALHSKVAYFGQFLSFKGFAGQ